MRAALWFGLALGSAMTLAQTTPVEQLATARDAVLPHVVSILVVREDFSQGEANLSLSGGSGTIIDAVGHVATNAHVVENGVRFKVVLNDDREFSASLTGSDPMSDLAVLKINTKKPETFAFAQFADALPLQPGQPVLAMGAPWGMKNSVTQGVISNTQRLMVSLFEDESNYEQRLDQDQATARFYAWIQHDASISPGNSGGPLVDLQGRIIGVNTRGGGDLAFAIPGTIAASVVDSLIQHGRVLRSDFGFAVRSLRGTSVEAGVLVSSVDRSGPADRAGLKAGDLVTAVDGTPVHIAEPEQVPPFRRELAERAVGSSAKLTVLRQGKTLALTLKSEPQAEERGRETEIGRFGVSVLELTPSLIRGRYLRSTNGLLIEGLRTGGPAAAAEPPLATGDVLLSVDGVAITSAEHLLSIVGEGALSGPAPTHIVDVERGGQRLLSAIVPEPKRQIQEPTPEIGKSWAGFDVQAITPALKDRLRLAAPGFRVTRIYDDSPASRAELKVGDIITAVAGRPVLPSGPKETTTLDLRVRNASRSEPFALTINRAGSSRELSLKLALAPKGVDRAQQRWIDLLKLVARELTFYDRADRNLLTSQDGVVLQRVESGGIGGLAHLEANDLLVRVGEREVKTLDDLELALAELKTAGSDRLSFLVLRGVDTRLLFVDAPWQE